jgi:hypothetical protein
MVLEEMLKRAHTCHPFSTPIKMSSLFCFTNDLLYTKGEGIERKEWHKGESIFAHTHFQDLADTLILLL